MSRGRRLSAAELRLVPDDELVWCANNRGFYRDQRDLADRVTCAGCGLPCPPAVPNPYQRPHSTGPR